MLHGLGGRQQIGRNSDRGSIRGGDGGGRGSGSLNVLVGSEEEEFVFDKPTAGLGGEVIGGWDGRGAGGQNGTRYQIERTPCKLHFAVPVVTAGIGNHVVNIASRLAKFGCEAI